MNSLKGITLGALALAALAAQAKADAPKWYDTLSISGFADAYYKLNPNGIQGVGSGVSAYDAKQNMFDVAGGKLTVKNDAGLVDVYFGNYATILSGSTAASGNSYNTPIVGQAYIAQAFGPLTATLGQFATHVGYEVTDSVANLNYTRSLLYGQVPFFHTGLKLAYAAPVEGLGIMVQLDNGNSVIKKANEGGGAGFQVSYTGLKGAAFYGNYYYEQVLTTGLGLEWEAKHYFDVVASYALMDGLTLAGEYLYWTQKASTATDTAGNALGSAMADPATGKLLPYSPKTQGYALYADYATPLAGLSVTPRFEALYMPDSFQTQFDYTLTARYVQGVVTNWLELRDDVKTTGGFAQWPKDAGGPTVPQSELTLTWGVGVKF